MSAKFPRGGGGGGGGAGPFLAWSLIVFNDIMEMNFTKMNTCLV